jgi:hypothetical protein
MKLVMVRLYEEILNEINVRQKPRPIWISLRPNMCKLNSIFTALTKNVFSSFEYMIKSCKTYEFFYYVRL